MTISVFDYINSINSKNYIYDEENCDGYNEYVINKAFSMFVDTVFITNEANVCGLKGKQHYDFLFYTIPKRKRFEKWTKELLDEELNFIMEYFTINRKIAKLYLKNLSKEQISDIKEILKKE